MSEFEPNPIICGWLFFSKSNRHCTFLPDDDQPQEAKALNWKILLDNTKRQSFVQRFAPMRTDQDALLEGYKIRIEEGSLRAWLKENEPKPA